MDLKLLIREKDIRMKELAETFGISRQSLYNYISLFEQGKEKEIPSRIRLAFDYICNVDFTTIRNIVAIFGGADPNKEYGEDNPLVWSSQVYVKTKDLFSLLKDIRKNGYSLVKKDDGSYRFNLSRGNHDVRFVIYDRHAVTADLFMKCKDAESFEDINKLFNEESRLAYQEYKTGAKIRDAADYDLPPWDEDNDDDEDEEEDYLSLEPGWVEHEQLKSSIIKELKKTRASSHNDIEKLKRIQNILISGTPEFDVVFKGNVTSVIKLKENNNYALCYCTSISDPTIPPKYENYLVSGDHLFYKICEGGEELIKLCDCIETSAMRIEYK